jgi:hypothetical protein
MAIVFVLGLTGGYAASESQHRQPADRVCLDVSKPITIIEPAAPGEISGKFHVLKPYAVYIQHERHEIFPVPPGFNGWYIESSDPSVRILLAPTD